MILYSKVSELPDSEPVNLTEAKDHLKVTDDSENSYITGLISTARWLCEADSGLSFVSQTRVVKLDRFPCVTTRNIWAAIMLPYGPVQSVTSVSYVDTNLVTQAITQGNNGFLLDTHSSPAQIFPSASGKIDAWPSTAIKPNAVTIKYIAGFDDVSYEPLPPQARRAILQQLADMYENRQDEVIGGAVASEISLNTRRILDSIRVYWNANID